MKGIITDNDGQIQLSNHDLAIGKVTEQTAQSILKAQPGEFKSSPRLGVGIVKYLRSPLDQALKVFIKDNLQLGLIEAETIEFSNGDITIKLK